MMSRFIALLCLSVAGCSHNAPPAETAEPTGERYGSSDAAASPNEPKLAPASYEGAAETRRDTATQPPPPAGPTTRNPDRAATPKEPASTMSEPTSPPRNSAPAEDTTQPDNTKVNERDRSAAALTPMDQGNGETDLKLTQSVRQALMADKTLSFTAKNVKIITKDGKITLRGPVKTADERQAIEADARKAAGDAPIDNQIEVKK